MRITHRKAEQLDEQARRVIAAGFAGGQTAAAVHRNLIELLGEDADAEVLSERTVSRELRRLEWDKRQRAAARAQSIALLEAAKAVPGTPSEMLQALATQALMEDPQAFQQSDPVQVQRANLEAERMRLLREKNAIARDSLTLNREKFEALKTQMAAVKKAAKTAADAVEKAGESISPELRRKILDVYGLTEEN